MTSTFDFLMVLYSIIIGVSISQILTGIGHVIQGNKPVRLYWVHSGWVIFIFFLHIFVWFSAWHYATIEVWSMAGFMMFLAIPVVLFVASVITLPDVDPERNYDMRDYYYKNYRWLHAMLVAIIVLTSANEYLLLDQYPFTPRNLARGTAAFLLCAGLLFGNAKLHGFLITMIFLLIGFFTASYRESIGG
ncbi:MAG: hypothetical protein ACR2PZ_21170 [Pseudomonadales bacterium]